MEDQGGDWRIILIWTIRGRLFKWEMDEIRLESCSVVDFVINGAGHLFLA